MHLGCKRLPYSLRLGRTDADFYDNVSTVKGMSNAVPLCERAMKPGAYCLLFRSAFRSGQGYKKLSKANREKQNNSNNGEGKKKVVFQVGTVRLHYIREVGNMMARKFRPKAHHVNVRNEAAHFEEGSNCMRSAISRQLQKVW